MKPFRENLAPCFTGILVLAGISMVLAIPADNGTGTQQTQPALQRPPNGLKPEAPTPPPNPAETPSKNPRLPNDGNPNRAIAPSGRPLLTNFPGRDFRTNFPPGIIPTNGLPGITNFPPIRPPTNGFLTNLPPHHPTNAPGWTNAIPPWVETNLPPGFTNRFPGMTNLPPVRPMPTNSFDRTNFPTARLSFTNLPPPRGTNVMPPRRN